MIALAVLPSAIRPQPFETSSIHSVSAGYGFGGVILEKKPLNQALGARMKSERALFRASGRTTRLVAIGLAVVFVWLAFTYI